MNNVYANLHRHIGRLRLVCNSNSLNIHTSVDRILSSNICKIQNVNFINKNIRTLKNNRYYCIKNNFNSQYSTSKDGEVGDKIIQHKQAVIDANSIEEAKEKISWLISNESRLLLIKGTPEYPMCGFSAQVLRIMNMRRLEYTFVNVLNSDYVREGAKIVSNWPTFPQLYENGEFVGGCDIVTELYGNL